jgi:hypothetical protein
MITHFDVDSDGGVAKLYTALGSSGVPESDAKEKKRAKKKSLKKNWGIWGLLHTHYFPYI